MVGSNGRLATFLFVLFYHLRNWRAHARGVFEGSRVVVTRAGVRVQNVFMRLFGLGETGGIVAYEGSLGALLIRADGSRINLGTIARRVITTAGVNYMRDSFAAHASSHDIQNFHFHDSGTGSTAEAIGDTALVTPTGTPSAAQSGSVDNATSGHYKSVGTISYSGTLAITEHGIFDGTTRATPYILWDRSVFSAINVNSGDSIQFTYDLTITAGG